MPSIYSILIILTLNQSISAWTTQRPTRTTSSESFGTFLYSPRVIAKLNITDGPLIDTTPGHSFLEFIRASQVWCDKSAFMRKLHKRKTVLEKNVFISLAPPRWGKSLLLSMARFYFEMPVLDDGKVDSIYQTASYKYFNNGELLHADGRIEKLTIEPRIKHDTPLNNDHLGKHPVIYFDMEFNWTADTVHDQLSNLIKDVYEWHGYIRNMWTSTINDKNARWYEKKKATESLNMFEKYLQNGATCYQDLIMAIPHLIECIVKYFKTGASVVVLVDNFDSHMQQLVFDENTFMDKEKQLVSNLIRDFYKFMLSSEYLHLALLTGTLGVSLQTVDQRMRWQVSTTDMDFRSFYGFSEIEIRDIARYRGIDKKLLDEALKWYHGYYALNRADLSAYYSTYSIVNFLNRKRIDNYFTDYTFERYIWPYFKNPSFIKLLNVLLEGKTYPMFFVDRGFAQFYQWSRFLPNDVNVDVHHHRVIMIEYLLLHGYLTASVARNVTKENFLVELPNMEIKTALRNGIERYEKLHNIGKPDICASFNVDQANGEISP